MANERTRRMVANICMSMVRNYFDDLTEYYAGDEGRFSRMVTDGGRQLPSASPQGWANHISLLSIECLDYHTAELRLIFAQLADWELVVDAEILGEVTNG